MQNPLHPLGGGYWAGVGCVAFGELIGLFGTMDRLEATAKANVAPAAFFAVSKPAGVIAGVFGLTYDLQIMLQARADCTQEMSGR